MPSVWLVGIGWCLATPLALGVLVGHWADSRTGRAPLFVIVGTLIGLAVGLYGSVRMLLQFLEQSSRDKGSQ
ncbi:MAG TPA: AtpZ/AtpI family protein [Dehalococcoidia bacterium]|nr:AtpZ/AtpI family protein [Dehalococcoidia bacterium]